MVAIFPNVCLWRRSYAQNWEALTLNNLREFFGQIVYRSPWQKIARTPMLHLGLKLWNSLPHNLTELTSYSSFKTSLKKYLIETAIN